MQWISPGQLYLMNAKVRQFMQETMSQYWSTSCKACSCLFVKAFTETLELVNAKRALSLSLFAIHDLPRYSHVLKKSFKGHLLPLAKVMQTLK